jgi:hypothetical protein
VQDGWKAGERFRHPKDAYGKNMTPAGASFGKSAVFSMANYESATNQARDKAVCS